MLPAFLAGLIATLANERYGTHPVVSTSDGMYEGRNAAGVDRFLGMRYAAAPVGALRFREAQPVQQWTGTRDATGFGAACVQVACECVRACERLWVRACLRARECSVRAFACAYVGACVRE